MKRGRAALVIYAVFLAAFSWRQFSVAAPSPATLIVLAGVAPFLAALGAVKLSRFGLWPAVVLGALTGIVVCVGAYGAHWWFFLAPLGGAPAVYNYAMRGLAWGLIEGGLAAAIAARR